MRIYFLRAATLAGIAICAALSLLTVPMYARAETITFPDQTKVIFNDSIYHNTETSYGSVLGAEGMYEVLESGDTGNGTGTWNASGHGVDDLAQAYLASYPCPISPPYTSMDPDNPYYYANSPTYNCANGTALMNEFGVLWFNANFTTASQYMQWENARSDTYIDTPLTQRDSNGRVTAIYGGPGTPSITAVYPNCITALGLSQDSNGFNLGGNVLSRLINKLGFSFCISNSSGANYFIPAKTSAELQSFYNAIPRLSSVSQQAP